MEMKFTERTLEDIIFKTDNEKLRERGLPICGKKLRQVKIGNYGKCDLISYKRFEHYPDISFINNQRVEINVYELKQNIINFSAIVQAIRYAKGILRYFECRNFEKRLHIKIILIGAVVDYKDDSIYLVDLCDNYFDEYGYGFIFDGIEIFTYNFDFDGISFKKHKNFMLIDEGFHEDTKLKMK